MNNALFHGDLVNTTRLIYTPSDFAKLSLNHIQEIGQLQATKPHTSRRDYLASYLFFFVTSGSGILIYDNNEYELDEGSCVFIDCRHPYSHSTMDNLWNLSWIHFDGPTLSNIYQKYIERGGVPAFKTGKLELYKKEFDELYNIAKGSSYTRDMDINAKLSSIQALLMSDSWNPDKAKSNLKKASMLEIKRFLDENYAEKITLDQLAKRVNINKYYMTRIFKEQFDICIMDYLQSVRINEAKNLLRFTNLSTEEIGMKTGIGDTYYFSRVFKNVEGITAREYRKQWH